MIRMEATSMSLADIYLLDNLTARERLGGAFLLIGMAGVVMLFLRDREADAAVAPSTAVAEIPEPDDTRDPAPCPACRGVIPAGWTHCPQCGWTYAAEAR